MINLAIVGTGGMANTHAKNFQKIKGVKIIAACDVNKERVEAFAKEYGIPNTYTDLDEMLKNKDIQAVSNVTPDRFHKETSLKIIKKGLHILCEKPLAENHKDAMQMAKAAKGKKIITGVNFSYRNAPAIDKAYELIKKGTIGEIKHFEASYLQSWLVSSAWGHWDKEEKWLWRLSSKHGSKGVLGDVGVHIVDFLTYPAGDLASVNCKLKTFNKAKGNKIKDYVLDANDSCIISAELKNGAVGTITATRFATGHANSVRISLHGTKGAIVVDLSKSTDTLEICAGKDMNPSKWTTVKCKKILSIYEKFIKSIQTKKNLLPDFDRGAKIQKVLDSCFTSDKTGKSINLK